MDRWPVSKAVPSNLSQFMSCLWDSDSLRIDGQVTCRILNICLRHVSIQQFGATFGSCDSTADRSASAYSHSFIFHFTWVSEHSIITFAFIQTNKKTDSTKQKLALYTHNKYHIFTHYTYLHLLKSAMIINVKTSKLNHLHTGVNSVWLFNENIQWCAVYGLLFSYWKPGVKGAHWEEAL